MAVPLDPRTDTSQELAASDGPVISAQPDRFDSILRPIRSSRMRRIG